MNSQFNLNLWLSWVNNNYNYFLNGCNYELEVPRYLPHPLNSEFKEINIAENVGQAHNYGLSLSDSSRIHIHEYPNGALIAHRDNYDPDASVISKALHLVTESPTAKLGLFFGIVSLIAIIAGKKIRA